MRGNPLFALTELTFSLPANINDSNIRENKATPDNNNNNNSNNDRKMIETLLETYPSLIDVLELDVLISSLQKVNENDGSDDIDNISSSTSLFDELLSDNDINNNDLIIGEEQNAASTAMESLDSDNSLNQQASLTNSNNNNQAQDEYSSLGNLFKHLQELDFGHCQLKYIKWTTLKNLNQLKRLLLDGNHLT